MEVMIFPSPAVKLDTELFVFEGESVTLNPIEVTGSNLKYLWTPNLGLNNNTLKNPVFTGSSNMRYTLTITGNGGCISKNTVLIKVLKPINPPNSFSPNGDGINDAWQISGLENYPGVRINIFNRYGVIIYTGNAEGLAWDGRLNGKELPVGVYYYVLNFAKFSKPLTGSVTIIR
jgi:gliding motility-associated-like protein